MNVLILGSRIYNPLADIDKEISTLPPGTSVTPIGESDVALRAESAGKLLGYQTKRRPLESTRRTLLELAEQGADVWLFVARDHETRQPTSGMAGIQQLLTDKGFPFRIISSELPGKVCQLITDLRHAVQKALTISQERRRIILTEKALKLGTAVADERDRYQAKLGESFTFGVGDDELDEKWKRWLQTYECLCDALNDAQRLLTPMKKAA